MKNSILPIFSLVFLITGCIKEEIDIQSNCDFIDFKYYNGTKDFIGELSNEYLLIGIDTSYTTDEIQELISGLSQFDQNYEYTLHTIENYKFKEVPLKLISSKTCEETTQVISDLEQNIFIAYAHYAMQTDNCENAVWEPVGDLCGNSYGSNIYVKVFDENDLSELNQMIADTNTELVMQNEFMPRWFELRATKTSKGNALAMANFFYESDFFEHSEPGISKYPVK